MMLKAINRWFVYNKEKDRFQIRGTLYSNRDISVEEMKEIADCSEEIVRVRDDIK